LKMIDFHHREHREAQSGRKCLILTSVILCALCV
jgi:hypothetical protein